VSRGPSLENFSSNQRSGAFDTIEESWGVDKLRQTTRNDSRHPSGKAGSIKVGIEQLPLHQPSQNQSMIENVRRRYNIYIVTERWKQLYQAEA
jgi:hypothetical protein